MMLLVQCSVVIILYIIVICHAEDEEETTDIHGDITGPGPGEYLPTLPEDENMFAKVFKYAFDNYYKNSSAPKKISSQKSSSQENRKKSYRNHPRQHQYYNPPFQAANPPMPPYQALPAQALPPQYIFPQHYYMPPVPPVPPYPMYHYPPPYPPHAYPYPYPPPQVKEKSAETKTTQNLWELYKELKAKFETTVVTTPEPTQQEYYHRHYNRRVQNGAGGYLPRDNNRRYNYQYQQQQYQQPQQQDPEKVPEEPFERYTPMQSNQRRENERSPPQMIKVKEPELKTSPPIMTTVTHPQENPQGITVDNGGNEHVFEPREEDNENVRAAKVKHWEGIIKNIKFSLGITDEPESNDATLPEYVKRDHAEIASLFFTESPEDLEAKKYGITLVQNSQADSYERNDVGFDWKAEEKAAAGAGKATKDWKQLYKEYKEKYEFPDYLQEKRRIERAEYKAKKKMLYKSRGLTYDDGNSDDGATLGDNTFLNLGRDPNYYPAVMRAYLKK